MRLIILVFLMIAGYQSLSQPFQLDSTFSEDGKLKLSSFFYNEEIAAWAIDGDQRIYVAVNTIPQYIIRLLADGTTDASFTALSVASLFYWGGSIKEMHTDSLNRLHVLAYAEGPNYESLYYVARINENGLQDQSYGNYGACLSNIYPTSFRILPEGEVMLAGYQADRIALEKILQTGVTDSSFGLNGIDSAAFDFPSGYSTLIFLNDGKIILTSFLSYDLTIGKILPDLTPDSSFSDDGFFTAAYGSGYEGINDAAELQNGNLVLTGSSSDNTTNRWAVWSFKDDGIPDSTLDSDGFYIFPNDLSGNFGLFVTASPDNSFLVGGKTKSPIGNYAQVFKFTPSAIIDSSWGVNGKFQLPLLTGYNYNFYGIQDSDGTALFAASLNYNGSLKPTITRLNASGIPDNSFGISGSVNFVAGTPYGAFGNVNKIIPGEDGKVLLVGRGGNTDVFLALLNEDGSIDSTYGIDGLISINTPLSYSDLFAASNLIAVDDNFIIVGSSGFNTCLDAFDLIKFAYNGEIDSSFGSNGYYQELADSAEGVFLSHVLMQPDGKILLYAESYSWCTTQYAQLFVERLLPNGVVDSAFGLNGKTSFFFEEWNRPTSMGLQPDGKIVVCASPDPFMQENKFLLRRFLADGSIDSTFGIDGSIILEVDTPVTIRCMKVLQDGKILLGGESWYKGFFFTRFLENGDIDLSFGSGGYIFQALSNYQHSMTDMILQPDGKIVVTGDVIPPPGFWHYDIALARFQSNGLRDSTFADSSFVLFHDNADGHGKSVSYTVDDKVLVCGSFAPEMFIARMSGLETGIYETKIPKASLIVFPNPATNTITIEEMAPGGNATIVVRNYLGTQMIQKSNVTSGSITINIAALPPGIYSVSRITDEIQSTTKFIKVH